MQANVAGVLERMVSYGPPRGGPARAGRPPARGPRSPWPHRARDSAPRQAAAPPLPPPSSLLVLLTPAVDDSTRGRSRDRGGRSHGPADHPQRVAVHGLPQTPKTLRGRFSTKHDAQGGCAHTGDTGVEPARQGEGHAQEGEKMNEEDGTEWTGGRARLSFPFFFFLARYVLTWWRVPSLPPAKQKPAHDREPPGQRRFGLRGRQGERGEGCAPR